VSLIELDNNGSEMDSAEEVTGGLVVAGGNAAILLDLVEELLNEVTRPIEVLVVVAWRLQQRLEGIRCFYQRFFKASMSRS
jgi:hypothetical protein